METKLDIVVVTYNRLDKLKKSLECLENQTRSFRNLILVDNCSTDGTDAFINEWEKAKSSYNKIVIRAMENLGGSGGFYLGQKKALELNADWVYVADDDAYADEHMVELFYGYIDSHDMARVSAICSSVRNMDGSICYFHRDRWRLYRGMYFMKLSSTKEDYQKSAFPIDLLSYVGSFLNVAALKKVGLVNPDYFIYFDDSEHSFRLKKFGDIICVPSMIVYHDWAGASSSTESVSWRDYYYNRNERHMIIKHMPWYVSLRYNLVSLLKNGKGEKRGKAYSKIYRCAILDAIRGKLGKHPIYHPGWTVTPRNSVWKIG